MGAENLINFRFSFFTANFSYLNFKYIYMFKPLIRGFFHVTFLVLPYYHFWGNSLKMAKKISDEIIKLSIVIDGNQAQKEILDLEKDNIRLKQSVAELNKQEKAKRAEFEKTSKTYNEHKAKMDVLRKAYTDWNAAGTKELQKQKEIEAQFGKTSAQYKAQERVVKNLEAEGSRLLVNQDRTFATVQKLGPVVANLSTEYNSLKSRITNTNTEIEKNDTRLHELTGSLKVTEMTIAQLEQRARELAPALAHMLPGSESYQKTDEELGQINDRLDELKGKSKESKFSIGAMADGFNRYAGFIAGFIAMLTGMVISIQKVLDWNGKLADSETKVMKTTGMTKREVDELTKSFGMLKTRSGRIELLGIAEIGGRLGIAKEEIADFVKVMDKSAVALGDSFEGGPNVVAEKLGRIKGLYEELKNTGVEEAFESVGSALNDLGADGTASEQNLAEFAQRVGTLPGALKPSIATALGLGAAFEESGLKAELAGNNYGKVITIAARDYPAFATVMKRSAADVKNLINTDPTEFFLQFSQSLKGLDATQLAQVLDYLKLNDNEVKMVLGAASENVDLFRDKIALAGDSMADATSLTTEYDLVNNNLAATLERLKKKVTGWFTSDSVVAFITSAVEKFAQLIGAVEDSDGAMNAFKNTLVFAAKILAILTTGFFSYTTAAKLATFWSNSVNASTAYGNIIFRIQYAQLVLQQSATKALALVQALLSGNIARVRVAYQALTVAMGMNPFGALLAIIGAVVAAFVMFRDEAEDASKVMNAMNEVQKDVADQTAKTKDKVSDLIKVLRDENATNEQKEKALKAIQKISNGYLDTLTKENMLTAEGTRLINRYIKSIDQLAMAKALLNVKARLNEQKLESDNKVLALSLEKKSNTNTGVTGGGEDGLFFGLGSRNQKQIQLEMDAEKAAGEQLIFQQKALEAQRDKQIETLRTSIKNRNAKLKIAKKDSQEYKELIQDIKSDQNALDTILGLEDNETPASVVGAYVPDEKGDKAADKAAKAALAARKKMLELREKAKEDAEKYQNEVIDLEGRGIDERLALMTEGFDKEEAIEAENHRRKIAALQKQKVDEAEILKIDALIDAPDTDRITKAYYMHTKESWVAKNKHLNTLIELEDGRHELAVDTIALKAETKRLVDQQDAFNAENTVRQTAHNNELAALGENAIAREKLQEKFDKEELDRQMEQLRKMLAAKEAIMNDQNSAIDLDLLTPEQRKEIEEQINALKLKLSELLLAKQALAGKGGTDDLAAASKQIFGDADVLGFTADQWGATFKSLDTLSEKMAAAKMVVGALQNMWGMYNDFLAASENAQVRNFEKGQDARRRKLKQQLDNGYINQTQYKQGIEQMDADLERKKADLEYKQAKRARAMAAVNIMLNTAQAIMGIWAQFPKVDFGVTAGIMSGVVGALGALQLATVMKTPLPARGYEKGLYPEYVKREQDGKMFKSTFGGKTRSGLVKRPTHFLTGENGPEMIIDAKAYRQMSPETKDMLIRELRGIKGFEKGYYNNDLKNPRYEVPAASAPAAAASGASQEYLLQVLAANTTIMEKLYNEGVIAVMSKDGRDMKKLQDELDRTKNSREKAKV